MFATERFGVDDATFEEKNFAAKATPHFPVVNVEFVHLFEFALAQYVDLEVILMKLFEFIAVELIIEFLKRNSILTNENNSKLS